MMARQLFILKNDDNKEYPPLILYKRDGGVLYGTTDLNDCERIESTVTYFILLINANPSFEQVFRAAKLTRESPPNLLELTILGYNFDMWFRTVSPLKTRLAGLET